MGATDRIVDKLVPEWVSHQQQKSKDYNSSPMPGFPAGFENADVLGVQGQFAEIWRKIWKLKRGMWDGAELVNESVREILLDLIGHCFLAIDMIDRAKAHPPAADPLLGIKSVCGLECNEGHTYIGNCGIRRSAGQRDA